MALKYHLVRRLDMRKNASEGSTLLYGQVRSNERITLRSLCEMISAYTSATAGDVQCVIKGLIFHMKQHLANGNTIHLDEFGSFRVTVGSSGVESPKNFHTSLFKKPRITFTPGIMLRDVSEQLSYKKMEIKKVMEECARPHLEE